MGKLGRAILGRIHRWRWMASSQGWEVGRDGAEPHGRGDLQQNGPGLLEEGLLPPTSGTHIGPSWLRAAPARLQEGITRGSSAWDSTTELVQKERERGFFLPLPGCQRGEMLLSRIPADPNLNGQPLSYLDFADFDSGVIL